MKKLILFFILTISFLCSSSITIYASEYKDIDSLESDIKNELITAIDDNVMEVLEEIGLDDFNFEEIYKFSISNITKFFSVTLKEKIKISIKNFFELLSVIMLIGIVTTLLKDGTGDNFITVLSVIVVTLFTVKTVSGTLTAVISVLEMSGKFMLSFVPIYTLVISLSGNTVSALTYNTLIIGFAEIISSVITSGLTDIIGVFFSLGISFSLNSNVNISRLISTINRAVSTVLGFAASLFTGFLGLKNVLAVSVDSLSVRGIRFLIGSLIPVVGSSISEAYSSLLGSINLIKGSVAVVGILVIIIINIPVIFETLVYYISFSLLSYVADSVYASGAGNILKCFACGLRILLLLCIFEMFILIISTGIILSVKNGG